MPTSKYTVTVDDDQYSFSPALPAGGVKPGDQFVFLQAANITKAGVPATPFTPTDNPVVKGKTYTVGSATLGDYTISPAGSRDGLTGKIKVNN